MADLLGQDFEEYKEIVLRGEINLNFELDLLQNSYDYINNSFDLYIVADEFGMHDEQRTLFENKVKWKLAFITMVQAFELLFKEVINRIHPNLIYEDIDTERISDKKTISFQQAIARINNFSKIVIEDENKSFLMNCSRLRNEFIHYKVNIQSEQIKSKYCKLYSIYKEFHNKLIGEDIIFYSQRHIHIEKDILNYDESWTVFRGREIRKTDLEEFKKEICENEYYNYYITKDGNKVERIRFGDEINRVSEMHKASHDLSLYTDFEICDDCYAKKGEYHLEECDLEICPVCFGQMFTCGCIDEMVAD